ncbi:MAG: 2-oxoacid:acceptor oxidoreductase family protein [Verrucomicrobiae bacterium]|nr:2-oxoacid:acceptor oxidoreductase family protein [Verrucomicrobiae bacterium]
MQKSLAGKVDSRFLREDGQEVFTGTELLVKGLLETDGGTHLWTGYPGSPVAGFFDIFETIAPLLKDRGIRASIANNEALAAAMVNGSQMLPLRAIAVMKSVGLHVASDALALGNLVGAHPQGGAIIVLGDDPWSESTQVPADSRFLARHLFMPVLEPSDPQELKDWIGIAYSLSRRSGFYIGYLVTTNQADGGGSVEVFPNHWPDINTRRQTDLVTADIPLDNTVLLPPRTANKEDKVQERQAILWAAAREFGVNRIIPASKEAKRAPLGLVASGMGFCYLQHALAEMGLSGEFPILKLGITYPVDPRIVQEFAASVENLLVIEERRPFIEEQILTILNSPASEAIPKPKVYGKNFPFDLPGIPGTRGVNTSVLIEKLGPLFKKFGARGRIDEELELIEHTAGYRIQIPGRTPTFCPGCPHRDSSSVLMEVKRDFTNPLYMSAKHGRGPIDLVFHGDTGCYTMLMFEPTKDLMHNYSGMGLGGATGAGIDPFIRNKQVVFMGDSTFFHSGAVSISNSLKQGQDITYIVLDNATTAMTGHQTTPQLGVDALGDATYQQSIDRIVQSMLSLGAKVNRVNPEHREAYRELLEDTILADGVKVVIADKECGITFHRRRFRDEREEVKRRGFLETKSYVNIAQEVCENCLECTKSTGCPGLTTVETEYGRKIGTDFSWCVSDKACTRVKVCPSFEEVVVSRTQAPVSPLDSIDLKNLPLPPRRVIDENWTAYLAGVGGMGIGVATATLVRAGFKEGYSVQFCDKKGLAIRNGGVYSHIVYQSNGRYASNIIPYGKADLLLGIDVLEAARAIDPKVSQRVGSERTAVILNTEKTPTILTLLGRDDFDPADLEEVVRRHTQSDRYFSANLSQISEKYFGTKLFSNVMMLGAAFQAGELPLSLSSLEWAIRMTSGALFEKNWQAFGVGRKLFIDPFLFGEGPARLSYRQTVEKKIGYLGRLRNGERLAQAYRRLIENSEMSINLDESAHRDLAIRIYDLIRFENAAYAKRYVDTIKLVFNRDSNVHGFAATRAAIWNLAKVMCIKDEIYVADLLTREEKYERDAERYGVDRSRGDRLSYVHINRPRFELGRVAGIKLPTIEFDFRTRDWMLLLMREAKFLRRLLPVWHAEEKSFRDWYQQLLQGFAYRNEAEYQVWLEIIRCPEPVTGYREVRYPKMRAERAKVAELLEEIQQEQHHPVGV